MDKDTSIKIRRWLPRALCCALIGCLWIMGVGLLTSGAALLSAPPISASADMSHALLQDLLRNFACGIVASVFIAAISREHSFWGGVIAAIAAQIILPSPIFSGGVSAANHYFHVNFVIQILTLPLLSFLAWRILLRKRGLA